jgi:hypothetical protein
MGDSAALALEDTHPARSRTPAQAEKRADDHPKSNARRGAAPANGVSSPAAFPERSPPRPVVFPTVRPTIQRPGRAAIFLGSVLPAAHHTRRSPARITRPGACSGDAQPRPHPGSLEVGYDRSSQGLLGRGPRAVLRPARRQRSVHRPEPYRLAAHHRPERRTRHPRHVAHQPHPLLEVENLGPKRDAPPARSATPPVCSGPVGQGFDFVAASFRWAPLTPMTASTTSRAKSISSTPSRMTH